MTPKDKAEQLVRKYYTFGLNNTAQSFSWYECKQCALIACDELINNEYQLADKLLNIIHDNKIKLIASFPSQDYWQEVKTEINKL